MQRLQHGGGSVALHRQQQARAHSLNRVFDAIGAEHLAPRYLDRVYLGTAAAGNLAQQMPETAEYRHQHLIARPNGGNQQRFDAGA